MTYDQQAAAVTLSMRELEGLVKGIAEDAAEKSARKVLAEIGLSTADEDKRAEAHEDIRWLRRWRRAADAAAGTIGRAVLIALVGGALSIAALLVKIHVLKQP